MILLADEDVHRVISDRGPLLLTNDLDFGELVYTRGARHTGVLLLRLGDLSYADQADLVARVIAAHGDQLRTAFSVLDPNRLRIRGSA